MMPDGEAICIVMKSLPGNIYLRDKVVNKDTEKCVECTVHCCTMYIKKLSPNKLKYCFIFSVDPHLNYVPMWLLNFGMKGIATIFFREVAKRAENLNPMYRKLI